MMAGLVLGMAHTMVTPPARAAAVPDAKSSLCVPPGSRRWTWTSISPGKWGSVGTGSPWPWESLLRALWETPAWLPALPCLHAAPTEPPCPCHGPNATYLADG